MNTHQKSEIQLLYSSLYKESIHADEEYYTQPANLPLVVRRLKVVALVET